MCLFDLSAVAHLCNAGGRAECLSRRQTANQPCTSVRMLGSPFLISPPSFFYLFPNPVTHFTWRSAGFLFFRTSCRTEASVQGQIAVPPHPPPPHTNSPAFSFFNALLACQQKWAGMDCFALKVSDRVIERGKSAADVRGYSLMGLI